MLPRDEINEIRARAREAASYTGAEGLACEDVNKLLDHLAENDEALRACIPWVATSARGSAQEALADACRLTGQDPFDWSSHPDVLARRLESMGVRDRRKSVSDG